MEGHTGVTTNLWVKVGEHMGAAARPTVSNQPKTHVCVEGWTLSNASDQLNDNIVGEGRIDEPIDKPVDQAVNIWL